MGRTFTHSFKAPTLGKQTTEQWENPDMNIMDSFSAQFHVIDGMKTSVEWGEHFDGWQGKRNMIVYGPDGKYVWGDAEFYPNHRFQAGQLEAGVYTLVGNFEKRGGGYYGVPVNSGAYIAIVGYLNP